MSWIFLFLQVFQLCYGWFQPSGKYHVSQRLLWDIRTKSKSSVSYRCGVPSSFHYPMSYEQLCGGSLVLRSGESSLTSIEKLGSAEEGALESIIDPSKHEIWKTIEDYPQYSVSSFGKISSTLSGGLISQTRVDSGGYPTVTLHTGEGKPHRKSIHTLVAKAFLPKVEGKQFVNHIDKNRRNNYVSNLRYVTPQESNRRNRISRRNSSGVIGVRFNKTRKKWHAYIGVDYKQLTLGYYESKNEAVKARKKAEKMYFGGHR
jgi:hypothetical protein